MLFLFNGYNNDKYKRQETHFLYKNSQNCFMIIIIIYYYLYYIYYLISCYMTFISIIFYINKEYNLLLLCSNIYV